MMVKAVIFDLDGTLVDVRENYPEESLGYAFGQFGIEYTDEDMGQLWFGNTRDVHLKKFGFGNPEDFWKVFVEYDVLHRRENTLIYNDSEVVNSLKRRGKKVGIVTGSNSKAASQVIELLGMDFDSVVCAAFTDGIRPKPDPQGLEICMKKLEVDRTEAMYVGDNTGDILTARNAGVKGVLVDRGRQTTMLACVPDAIVKNLYEVLELVD